MDWEGSFPRWGMAGEGPSCYLWLASVRVTKVRCQPRNCLMKDLEAPWIQLFNFPGTIEIRRFYASDDIFRRPRLMLL